MLREKDRKQIGNIRKALCWMWLGMIVWAFFGFVYLVILEINA